MATKVLVIDDDSTDREFAKRALEGAGYEVVTHDSGVGATTEMLAELPDLILLDVQMPDVTGDTLAKVLKKAPGLDKFTLVLYSSLPEADLKKTMEETKANGYIRKTDDTAQLVEQVRKYTP